MRKRGLNVSLALHFSPRYSGKRTPVGRTFSFLSPNNDTFYPAFVGILTNMRHGMLTVEDVQHLRSLSRPLHYPDGIEPSQLC